MRAWKVVSIVTITLLIGLAVFLFLADRRKPARLEATPPQLMLNTARKPVHIDALLVDRAGRRIDGAAFVYSSTDPKVAVVDAKGDVMALYSGQTKILVRAAGMEAQVDVDVLIPGKMVMRAGDVSSATYTPGAKNVTGEFMGVLTMDEGEQLPLTADLFDEIGRPMGTAAAKFLTNIPPVAEVSADGAMLLGKHQGMAVLAAESPGLRGFITLAVLPLLPVPVVREKKLELKAGQTRTLWASLEGDDRRRYPPPLFTFTSDSENVAIVNPAGDVTAVSPGKTTVRVTIEYATVTVDVSVAPDLTPFQSARGAVPLAVTPAKLTMKVGETRQLTAALKKPAAKALPPNGLTYWSTAPAVAVVNTQGQVYAQKAGTALIGVASGDSKAPVEVTVLTGPAALATAAQGSPKGSRATPH